MRALETKPPAAVLFDRDGTLIEDVGYTGDPSRISVLPRVLSALRSLRERGVPVGVVTNQAGIGRGAITAAEVAGVNREIDRLIGPFDVWCVCPHREDEGCGCRKPRPGMILAAARALGVDPRRIAVVGDIGADMEAARAAGARGVLVPTPVTRAEEIREAESVATDLESAVALLFDAAPALPALSPAIGSSA